MRKHLMLAGGFEVSANGHRFLTVQQVEKAGSTPVLTVVKHWILDNDKQEMTC